MTETIIIVEKADKCFGKTYKNEKYQNKDFITKNTKM